MTAAIRYDSESEIVETGDATEVVIGVPAHTKWVKITESDRTIRLVPFDLLDEAERALLSDRELYRQTRQGLADFSAGKGVSSDWLFADDE